MFDIINIVQFFQKLSD